MPDGIDIHQPIEREVPFRRGERLGPAEKIDEPTPVALPRRQDAHMSVRGRQHQVVAVPVAWRRGGQHRIAAIVVGERNLPRIEAADRGLLHRDLDRLSGTETRAIEQRGQGAHDRERRRAVVRGEARQPTRRAIGKTGGEQRAGGREGHQRLGAPVRARAGEPEVGDDHVHELWMALAQRLGSEVEHLAAIRPVVLQQHVGAAAQVGEARGAFAVVQIDDRAALVGVAIEKRQ